MAIRLPDGTVLRNLQEQVLKNKQDIEKHYETQRVLEDYGIQIVGSVETVEQLPDPTTYTGSFGDGYTVGPEGGPLTFYIYTRPNEALGETTNRWLDLGSLAIAGPEGPMGPQGEQGPAGTSSKWYVDTKVPVGSGYQEGDMCLITRNTNMLGQVYRYANNTWHLAGNIRGPQGPIGPEGKTGPRGPQGEQGPVGPRGAPAPIVEILGMLESDDQLPDPSSVDPNAGFLITEAGATYLFIIVNGIWTNSGRWGGGTSVYEDGEFVETFDADTKVSKMKITNSTTYLYAANKNGDINPSSGAAIACSYNTERYDAHVPRYIAPGVAAPVKTDRACLVSSEPTKPGHVATKNYVDNKIAAAHEGGFQPHARLFAVHTENADEPPQYTVYAGLVADNWDYQGFINFPVESLVIYQSGNYTPMAGAYILAIERVDSDYTEGLGSPIEWSIYGGNVTSVSGDGYVTQSEYEGENQTIKLTLRVLTGADEAYIQITQYPSTSSYVHY